MVSSSRRGVRGWGGAEGRALKNLSDGAHLEPNDDCLSVMFSFVCYTYKRETVSGGFGGRCNPH